MCRHQLRDPDRAGANDQEQADRKAHDADDLAPFELIFAVTDVALVGRLHGHEAEHAADDAEATAAEKEARGRDDQPSLSLFFELGIGRTARTKASAARNRVGHTGRAVAARRRARRRIPRRTVATG